MLALEELVNKIWERLKEVRFPGMSRDIVSFGFVDSVDVEADRARVALAITTHNPQTAEQVKECVAEAVGGLMVAGSQRVLWRSSSWRPSPLRLAA